MRRGTNKSQPAYQQSYEVIRDMILQGELPRGAKIVEERLAEKLGMSRTPIRESIRKLEQEGLIQNKMAATPTERELRNTFQVRILLEGYSASCAASYLSDVKLNRLWECVEEARGGNVERIMRTNQDFHEIIVEASNNPAMIEIIDRMQSIIYLFRHTVVYYNRPFLIDEHEKICEAIQAHDAQAAERRMQEHLQADLDFYLHLGGADQPRATLD